MVLGVTSLQRGWLELTGLLRYLRIYKPRMEDPTAEGGLPDDCVGVFTSDPTIAQLFRIARLPYFFVRPLNAFKEENILRVVQPLDPTVELVLDAAPGYSSVASFPWYKDPFLAGPSGQQASPIQYPQQAASSSRAAESSSQHATVGRAPTSVVRHQNRTSPYSQARVHAKAMKSFSGANPNAKPERDKYMVFDSPDMPPAIDSWARSLAKVDSQLLLALHLLLAHGFRLARD
ncbi:hypothetical protein B0H14DRAFT_3439116 [Mycena olivaceomarginata]|nr:hypothetical protein B0H14DRAFT_3439116 [Mycena olivaceomarginata]